jgi:hypothetical protein
LQQIVVRVVTGEPLLQERIDDQQDENQAHDQRHPDGGGNGVVPEVELPRRPDAGEALGPHHVEVGLRTGRHLRWLVGTQVPDRVDLQQPAHEAQHTDDGGEKRAGLDGEHRHHAHADDVVLGAARAGELGVLLEPHQPEM